MAAADIVNQYANLKRYLSQKPAIENDKQNQMKFKNNDNVQIIYNHYYNNNASSGIIFEIKNMLILYLIKTMFFRTEN